MIRWMIFALCSLACFADNPRDALDCWPAVHPPNVGQGCLQSPIDIRYEEAVQVPLPPLRHENLLDPYVKVRMTNTGTTVNFQIWEDGPVTPIMYGGPLKNHGEFQFDSFHLHWGKKDMNGSEHYIEGKSYAIEGHSVYFNTKYGTYREAKKNSDGLAVVAFFWQAGRRDNPKLKPLVDRLRKIRCPKQSVLVNASVGLTWLPDLETPTNYYTYPGSLTTKPYSENVFWIVYPEPLYISSRQVNAFRKLLSKDYRFNKENSRPLQEFNCRPLIYAIGN